MLDIKRLRTTKGVTQARLAQLLGVSRSTVSMWEIGASEPDNDMLKAIADYFGVSVDALLGRDAQPNVVPYTFDDEPTVEIDVYGRIPAGVPLEALEDKEGTVHIPRSWLAGGHTYFGLIVNGDSMYPDYFSGDIVIVRCQATCNSGDDCVVYVNSDYEATLKKVYWLPDGSMQLRPNNQNYAPVTYTPEQIEKLPVVIAGVVRESRRIRP